MMFESLQAFESKMRSWAGGRFPGEGNGPSLDEKNLEVLKYAAICYRLLQENNGKWSKELHDQSLEEFGDMEVWC